MTDPTTNKSFISGEPDVIFNNLGVNDSWDKDTSPTKTCGLYEG
jgi:lysophospholipase L1-like esterase